MQAFLAKLLVAAIGPTQVFRAFPPNFPAIVVTPSSSPCHRKGTRASFNGHGGSKHGGMP